jgi:hypothetical protein
MSIKKELEDYLRNWHAGICKLVAAKQIWVPERFDVASLADGKTQYTVQEPICLGSLPLGSGMSRKQPKVWAFIDGSFVSIHDGDDECLSSFGASIVFFEAKPRYRRFRLLDAFHFDYHCATIPSSPHPMFHTQRNIRWEVERWKQVFDRGQFGEFAEYRFPNFNHGVKAVLFKLTRFRVPTARIDLFAAILATLADLVVQHDVAEHCGVFNDLVDLTASDKNPLHRLMRPQVNVPICFEHSRSSAHTWYPRYSAQATGR